MLHIVPKQRFNVKEKIDTEVINKFGTEFDSCNRGMRETASTSSISFPISCLISSTYFYSLSDLLLFIRPCYSDVALKQVRMCAGNLLREITMYPHRYNCHSKFLQLKNA